MQVTVKYLENKFNQFNKEFFNNELPAIKIRLSSAKNWLGQYVYNRNFNGTETPIHISISTRYEQTGIEYCNTLIHEMIHYWLSVKGIYEEDKHGYFFCKKMREINNSQTKYHITIRGNREPKLTKKKEFAFLQFSYKGKQYISRISERGLVDTKVLDKFDRIPGVKMNRLYKSTDDKCDRIKMCVSRLRTIEFNNEFVYKFNLIPA